MPGTEFYRWQVRSFTVLLALDTVDRINQALHHPRIDPNEEQGGILFGYSVDENTAEVTDFELVHSAHRRGIPYDLSPHERHQVGQRVQSLSRQHGPRPIGYFRTHLRPGLFLDHSDLALMTGTSFDGAGFALAIRSNSQGPPEAGIFFPECNEIDCRQPALKFPFDAELLRVQGPIEEAPDLDLPDAAAEPYRHGIKVKTLVTAFAYALAGAILALATISELHERGRAQANAKSATLSAGSPGPAAGPAGWQALAAPPAVFADDPANSDHAGQDQSAIPVLRSPFEKANRNDPAEHIERTDPTRADKTEEAPPFREAAPAAADEPSSPVIPPAAPLFPPASVTSLSAPSNLPPPARVPAPPAVVAPPPVSAVSVDVRVEPREDGPFKRAARRLPSAIGHVPLLGRLPGLRRDHDDAVVEAARPDADLSPKIPADVSRNMTEQVEVDVDASIDPDGDAKNIEVVRGDDPQLSALAENAVRAAHWKPARAGDRSVPMNVVVHYRFSPGREP